MILLHTSMPVDSHQLVGIAPRSSFPQVKEGFERDAALPLKIQPETLTEAETQTLEQTQITAPTLPK